ncbi:MAG: CPBP family intramembrane metalloprotease [Planctomycetota bacterium]|nr:MAG: CPBP family intramembrane metalloprotease [Planctomycetota bacterium]
MTSLGLGADDLGVIRAVARKELVEIVRDRRSLFVLLLLPVALYPLLLIGSTLVATAQQRKLRAREHVVWVEDRAQLPSALERLLTSEEAAERREDRTPESRALALRIEAPPLGADYGRALAEQRVDAVLRGVPASVPPGGADEPPTVEVLYNGGLDASVLVRDRLLAALDAWREELVRVRLDRAGLSPRILEPIRARSVDRGPPGAVLARVLALLLVVLATSGAFYPALDLGAGEKERGTLETLLLTPVSRVAIAVGKFVAVCAVTLACALLHVLSLGLTFASFSALAPGQLALSPDPRVLPAMLLVLVPLVALFSALALALATLAASYKEGQAYLSPVLVVGMAPAMAAAMPGMEPTPVLCLVPVLGPSLLLKALLSETYWAGQVALVVGSSFVYAGLAVRWAASLYRREEVLWRPAAARAPDLLGLRGLPAGADRLPSLPQAVALAVLCLLLLWFVWVPLQAREGWAALALAGTLLLGVALPPLAYARLLRCDLRGTFSLRRPRTPWLWLAALLLALGCVGLVLDLQHLQASWVGPVSAEELKAMERRLSELRSLGPGGLLVLFALLPALCEELLFRGFVLTGLRREGGAVAPVLLTALLFALFHLDPARLLPTFVVGVVLGAVVVRGESLYPAVLLHACYNALVLGLESFAEPLRQVGLLSAEGPARPSAWLRLLAAVCLVLGATLLAAGGRRSPSSPDSADGVE